MADQDALVPVIEQPEGMARLNITYGGQQGDLPDPVPFDMRDNELKQIATESVRTGSVPGIDEVGDANFDDFVVDRFPSREDVPYNRLSLRPKTPFGASGIQDGVVLPGNSSYAHCRCGHCFDTIIVNDIDAHVEGTNPPEDAYCDRCLEAGCPDKTSAECLSTQS